MLISAALPPNLDLPDLEEAGPDRDERSIGRVAQTSFVMSSAVACRAASLAKTFGVVERRRETSLALSRRGFQPRFLLMKAAGSRFYFSNERFLDFARNDKRESIAPRTLLPIWATHPNILPSLYPGLGHGVICNRSEASGLGKPHHRCNDVTLQRFNVLPCPRRKTPSRSFTITIKPLAQATCRTK
jgi:hypothetical protein